MDVARDEAVRFETHLGSQRPSRRVRCRLEEGQSLPGQWVRDDAALRHYATVTVTLSSTAGAKGTWLPSPRTTHKVCSPAARPGTEMVVSVVWMTPSLGMGCPAAVGSRSTNTWRCPVLPLVSPSALARVTPSILTVS